MLKAKLTKVKSNHDKMRTNEMEGKCTHIPEEGYSFLIFGKPLTEEEMGRQIKTSPVKNCVYDEVKNEFHFETLNSYYRLKILDGRDPFEYCRYKGSC